MINIGSQNSNDIIIDNPSVGRNHCKVWMTDSNDIVIQDLGSKNGTFINDRKIQQFKLRSDSLVRLGDFPLDLEEVKNKLQEIQNQSRTDFTKEYQDVFSVMEQYEKRKAKLLKRPLLPVLIRLGFGLAVIVAMLLIKMDDTIRIALIMSVGLLSVVAGLMGPSSSKKTEKLELLKLEYEEQLVCPKCKWRLVNSSLAYWKARKKCGNQQCDAIYD